MNEHKQEVQQNSSIEVQQNSSIELQKDLSDGCQKKLREEKEYRDLINRLSRIEGQIRGIKGMVEKDCYCTDILVQVAAVSAALNSFNRVLLANHIRTCVADGIRQGNDEKIDELVELLQKLMK